MVQAGMTATAEIPESTGEAPPPPPTTLVRWLIVVMLVCGTCALVGLPARATYGARTTADEPQYLLSALSLAEDADLDISDEIAERSYLPFHRIPIERQTRPLDQTGRQISPHDPLLPLLLAGPMALGGWVAAKAALALLAAATAMLAAWIAVRRFGVGAATAGMVTVACFGGLPLAGYATQIYPEMPAAFALCAAVALVTAPSWRSHRIEPGRVAGSTAAVLGSAAAITVLPWMSIKYLPVAFVAGLGLLWRLRKRRVALALVVGLGATAGVLFLVAHQWIYGGWTAYASSDHFADTGEFSVVGTQVNVLGRARRLPGLLVDRGFGLVAWSPVWLLLVPSVGAALRRARRREVFLVALVGAAWLNATFVALTMHGWWVPGRQLVVALPLAAVLLAVWADRVPRRLWLAAALGAVGIVNWVWLAIEASSGRRTLVVDFFETAAPGFRLIRPILPDGIRSGPADMALLGSWTVIIAAAAFAGWHKADTGA